MCEEYLIGRFRAVGGAQNELLVLIIKQGNREQVAGKAQNNTCNKRLYLSKSAVLQSWGSGAVKRSRALWFGSDDQIGPVQEYQ